MFSHEWRQSLNSKIRSTGKIEAKNIVNKQGQIFASAVSLSSANFKSSATIYAVHKYAYRSFSIDSFLDRFHDNVDIGVKILHT